MLQDVIASEWSQSEQTNTALVSTAVGIDYSWDAISCCRAEIDPRLDRTDCPQGHALYQQRSVSQRFVLRPRNDNSANLLLCVYFGSL